MKISEPAVSTSISDLPTPRLRARAMELYTLHSIMNDLERLDDFDLFYAFDWEQSDEGFDFWEFCYNGVWDKAKELQPDLFKPMDGKPHIKIHRVSGLIVVNYPVLVMTPNLKLVYKYIQEVSPREDYTTIQEAVDALYSYRRN